MVFYTIQITITIQKHNNNKYNNTYHILIIASTSHFVLDA